MRLSNMINGRCDHDAAVFAVGCCYLKVNSLALATNAGIIFKLYRCVYSFFKNIHLMSLSWCDGSILS